MKLFDESRLSVNAFEMTQFHNFLIPSFDSQPDMWNTKPPLMVWSICLSMKLFGFADWVPRFPALLAGFFTLLVVYFFASQFLKSSLTGIIACLVMITSPGWLGYHGVLTADYEGFLVLFTCIANLSFYAYLQQKQQGEMGNTNWWIFGFSLLLVGFTKGIMAFLFLPAYFLYVLLRGQLNFTFFPWKAYLKLFFLLAILITYYLLREVYNKGYLLAVNDNEFLGRFTQGKEGNVQDTWYFLSNLFPQRFSYWVIVFPLSIVFSLIFGSRQWKQFSSYILCLCLLFLLIISVSKTKLAWYDLPLYPLMAISIGMGISTIYAKIKDKWNKFSQIVLLFFACIFFVFPLKNQLKALEEIQRIGWEPEKYAPYIKYLEKNYPNLKEYTVLYEGYSGQTLYYQGWYNSEKNFRIESGPRGQMEVLGKNVMSTESQVLQHLRDNYRYELLDSTNELGCVFWIVGPKKSN